MEISFTGIRNLQIAKSRQIKNKIGLYPSSSGKIKQGELGICEYKIRMDLTDDSEGKDYNELLVAMGKAQKGLNTGFFSTPNKVEIQMTKHNILDDDIYKDYSFSTFKINGEDVTLTDRKGLSLYTYMAKLTRELKQKFNLSDNQKEIINTINSSIQSEAEKFIELLA